MATDPRANDVAAYATAVRTALGDLPADEKTALLEDLEEHLSEGTFLVGRIPRSIEGYYKLYLAF